LIQSLSLGIKIGIYKSSAASLEAVFFCLKFR
jgi:hypothetical protein